MSFPFPLPGLGYAQRGGGGRFESTYKAYPVAFMNRPELESGGKIILPPSALDRLTHLNIQFPMLFECSPRQPSAGAKSLHCGVLEFVAEEGHCYLPYWMMENLLLQEGDRINVKTVTLPPGTFVKLQPHSKTFLDISNPRAVLELELRKFSALTVGEDICITYNNRKYYLHVLEAKPIHPTHAVSIVETDVQVDFAPPMDYVEPQKPPATEPIATPQAAAATAAGKKEDAKAGGAASGAAGAGAGAKEEPAAPSFQAFAGTGFRLDGKPAPKQPPTSSLAIPTFASSSSSFSSSPSTPSALSTSPVVKPAAAAAGAPAAAKGTLVFGGDAPAAKPGAQGGKPAAAAPEKKEEKVFVPFSGTGHKLQ